MLKAPSKQLVSIRRDWPEENIDKKK